MPLTPADQTIIDEPYRDHVRDHLWRPRFQRTGLLLAVPLAACASVVSIQHDHLSPLQENPALSPWQVVRTSLAQPAADGPGGGPARWCGPWGRPERWWDVEAHNVWFVLGPWCGHRSRTVARYDFACGARARPPPPGGHPSRALGSQGTRDRSTRSSSPRAQRYVRADGFAAEDGGRVPAPARSVPGTGAWRLACPARG